MGSTENGHVLIGTMADSTMTAGWGLACPRPCEGPFLLFFLLLGEAQDVSLSCLCAQGQGAPNFQRCLCV